MNLKEIFAFITVNTLWIGLALTMIVTSHGFPPISKINARVLILGSLPGRRSLEAGEYYAHPQNTFWKILGKILQFDHTLDYASRCDQLLRHRIAVWDVCAAAVRLGSLDAEIEQPVINDFPRFFVEHVSLVRIAFNGAVAESLFRRHVLAPAGVAMIRLPSTSPAHASMPFAAKLKAWRKSLQVR